MVGTPGCQHGTAVTFFCEVLSAPSFRKFSNFVCISSSSFQYGYASRGCGGSDLLHSRLSESYQQNDEACIRKLTHRQIILLCVYRLTFHPYAKYPGPILGKLTTLRAAYYAYTGDMHLDMERCHQKYGQEAGLVLPRAIQLIPCQGNLFGIVRTQS